MRIPELTRALRNAERHHAIEANARQQRAPDPQTTPSSIIVKRRGARLAPMFFVHRRRGADRLLRIDRLHLAFDRGHERERIAGRRRAP